MLNRRDFLFTGVTALAATGPFATLAQTAPPQAVPTDPIAAIAASLPPRIEGNYQIPERYWATIVNVRKELPAAEIHIMPQTRHLYLTLGEGKAIRYGVAIGQEGLAYFGTAVIGRKEEWPSWRPTDEMIERNPAAYEQYKDGMEGGPTNPLGARAMYFYQNGRDTTIRIHGTTSPRSIGSAASNGCFRMYNSHVMDLYNRVPIGTIVHAY